MRLGKLALIVVTTLGALYLAFEMWAYSQSPAPPPPAPAATLQVYARETIVDVTVTDAKGNPVHGLQQSDFTVLEDGKPMQPNGFEEHRSDAAPPAPTSTVLHQDLPLNTFTNVSPTPPSSAPLNVLLLDNLNTAFENQTAIRQRMIEFIDKLPAGTHLEVLSLGPHLSILQGFTADHELLKAAVTDAKSQFSPLEDPQNGDPTQEPLTVEEQGTRTAMRTETLISSMRELARYLGGLPGRKNLLWFTVGIPAITDPSLRPECLPDYSLSLSHAYDQLTAAQVSVYPISAIGVDRLGGRELSMQMVAEATGGIAYSESNDMATSVLKAINNGANYYAIAYTPPNPKYNGAYHKIEVKVDKPGVQLVFRKGYFSDDLAKDKLPPGLTFSTAPPPANAGNMKAPMSRGMPTSQQILFDVDVERSTLPPKPGDPQVLGTLASNLQGKRLVRYAFSYSVPAQQVAFSSGPGNTHKASLDFDIAVFDANDKLLTGLSQVFKASVTDKTYQQLTTTEPIRFIQQIDLPPNQQLFLRVGVLDHATNKYGTLELPLKIGKK